MRYLEINPYWNVPKSILKKELIHDLKKDPELIQNDHYEIVTGWGDDSPVLDPSTIDWNTVNAATFPGRVRQKPGPWNALGRIKFMFPNQFHVYMHDTPGRRLFRKAHRALSHGCIRLEKPVDLALFVLKDNPKWNRKKIQNAIQDGERKIVGVPGKVTVHLMYFTSWMEDNGEVQFRRDIYERDGVLWQALNSSANGSGTVLVMEDALLEAVLAEQTDIAR
jgi:murein L,D-transpeptidase YcbB/YkuD